MEKAFDRLNCQFLFEVLQSFGIIGTFQHALDGSFVAIYLFKNGTRQGCPLSPFIFVLCIEPLGAAIGLNMNIAGVHIRDREFKISLFAGNVLLTLTNLHIPLLNLYAQLQNFSLMSGYKINTSKTEALSVNLC